jgi:hypothetical protein
MTEGREIYTDRERERRETSFPPQDIEDIPRVTEGDH